MKKIQIIFSLCLCYFSINSGYGQGGWDINYKAIQKNVDSLIGKEVRIDFRKIPSDTIVKRQFPDIRYLLRQEDSVKLKVSGKNIIFKEVWKIYRDMGFVSYQYLESISYPTIKLENMTLQKISTDSITIDALLTSEKGNKTIRLAVEKKKVKGLLFKRKRQ